MLSLSTALVIVGFGGQIVFWTLLAQSIRELRRDVHTLRKSLHA